VGEGKALASAHTSNPKDPLSATCSDSRSVYMSPSVMFEDSPVHVDRILAIEAMVDDMRSQNKATHRLLQDILDKLGPAQAQNVPDPIRSPTWQRPILSYTHFLCQTEKEFS